MEPDKTQHLQSEQQETPLRKCPQCDTIFSAIAYCPNDGTKLEIHLADGIGHTLFAEKYEILEEIGKGGMGTVYRAKQVMLDKIFALKIIPPHYLNEQLAVRFQREARTMASLDHANLGRICDYGIWLNQPFIVMEYIEGSPLSRLISERVIPPALAIELFCQVLEGLSYAHQKGVLHRDIKPSNIMVCRQNEVNAAILLDFGIAKKIDSDDGERTQTLTRTGEMIGSPLYMSPEQARGDKLTEQSDLYSVGCALFESLTGTPPFVGKTAVETFLLHIEQTPPTLKEAALGREFSQGLEDITRKLLAKNPQDRYASAEELKHALALCLQSGASLPEIKLQEIKKKTKPVLPFAILALASLALLAAVGMLLLQGEKTAKAQTKILALGQEPTVLLYPKTLPDSLLNSDNELTVGAEVERTGRVSKSKDGSLVFYKRVLDRPTAEAIVNDQSLKTLSINLSSFPKDILARLPKTLRRLELNGAGLNNEDYDAIAANQNLTELNLRFNIITPQNLQSISRLQKLTMLDLNGTHIESEALAKLKALKNLRTLIVSDNEQIDNDAMLIISEMRQLQWLDISNTQVTSKGLRPLSKLPNLRILSLKRLSFVDDGMPVLNNFKKLQILKLTGNPITTNGIALLNPTLQMKELDLSDCPLDDDVAPLLLRFKKLRMLHLSKTQVTHRGFLKLAALPLSAVWCKKCNLTFENAYEFLDRCPTCDIVYYTHNDSDAFTRSDYFREKESLKGSARQ